jgi:hypothetical protein
MRKIKVIEVIEAYEFDIEMLRADKKNSNRSKLIQRDELMLQFLRTVPKDLYLSCEGTATDSAKLNAGSLTECILNYHLAKEPIKEVAKAGGLYDTKRGCIDVEIKLSINGSCYNSPIQDKMLVYLVNRDGVFMIRKADIDNVLNKGKLPFKACEGLTIIKSLTEKMGFEI